MRRLAIIAALIALIALPTIADNYVLRVATTMLMYSALALGWNFIGGYTGYASFGNAAYLGLGAFVAAGFMSRQAGHVHMPWFAAIPLSVLIVALVAGVIGIAVHAGRIAQPE